MEIVVATSAAHWATARALIQEYVDWLGIDLSYQNYAGELQTMEQMYSPPEGLLLLAKEKEGMAGCIAFRKKGEERCEMKRLYVRPAFRGRQLGKKLAKICIEEARRAGYKQMVLDTLPSMQGAVSIYKGLGFEVIPPYYNNPVPDVIYLGLDL
ncbi:MAG: GNAT family N-acetyltransferase [Saprospiraceae bacterium]|nr:GNAT family N-acetyltransferase [Saprospiraceae bacterium]